jgi:hypothetical protein
MSTQQALAAGAPAPGMVSNADQMVFMGCVVAAGAGERLREGDFDEAGVRRLVEHMLSTPAYRASVNELILERILIVARRCRKMAQKPLEVRNRRQLLEFMSGRSEADIVEFAQTAGVEHILRVAFDGMSAGYVASAGPAETAVAQWEIQAPDGTRHIWQNRMSRSGFEAYPPAAGSRTCRSRWTRWHFCT